ncbi:hypothetical protein ACFQMF_14535 [Halorubrum rutilum]|uniref:Uncharacterized protein n=1 Tax=Halorubrum rutilum TaxID=1364933 RepID=A0ABD6ANZ4_9EURY|nr:hypothetical protein [Halorubrum rutilum]
MTLSIRPPSPPEQANDRSLSPGTKLTVLLLLFALFLLGVLFGLVRGLS